MMNMIIRTELEENINYDGKKWIDRGSMGEYYLHEGYYLNIVWSRKLYDDINDCMVNNIDDLLESKRYA